MQVPDFWIYIKNLESINLKYFVTGSVATIFYGEPRLTHDIDLVLHLEIKDVSKFENLFSSIEFYCPPSDVIIIEMNRKPYGHFNLIHHKTGFKADIYLEGNDPLHSWALENRKKIQISEDQSVWLAPPEYIIIRKLEFFREGGSDKHLRDLKSMLPQVKNQLDENFLNSELSKRDLYSYWKKI